jgi:hypothetical protein
MEILAWLWAVYSVLMVLALIWRGRWAVEQMEKKNKGFKGWTTITVELGLGVWATMAIPWLVVAPLAQSLYTVLLLTRAGKL